MKAAASVKAATAMKAAAVQSNTTRRDGQGRGYE